jgi:hypothetical protein
MSHARNTKTLDQCVDDAMDKLPPAVTTKTRAARSRMAARQTDTMSLAQLPLWPDATRGIPNELLRSALFNARNRKVPRHFMKDEEISVLGNGRISYRGEELRQDDETVWLQLVHLARPMPIGAMVEFVPASFLTAIGWPTTGQSYDRLRDCIRRLQATSLAFEAERLEKGVSLSMIPEFEWQDATKQALPRWRVRLHLDLVKLFAGDQYTRVEWEQRKSLPVGLATWLHGFFATHRVPLAISLEDIARGAGLLTSSPDELRRSTKKALDELVKVGFLKSYSIKKGAVQAIRAGWIAGPAIDF